MTTTDIQNLFKDTKYGKTYINIITQSKNEDRMKTNKQTASYVYYESHHILPKSLFKEFSNLKNYQWNGVLLTAREHFICHVLLVKHYRKIKDKNAYYKMSLGLKRLSEDGKHNSKIYETLKLNFTQTEATKTKMRKPKHTSESKQKLRGANIGKKQSLETINRRILKTKGMKRTEESKKLMSENQKGINTHNYRPITIYNSIGEPIVTSLFKHSDNLTILGIPKTALLKTLKNNKTMYE